MADNDHTAEEKDKEKDKNTLFWLISVPKRKSGEDVFAELNRTIAPKDGHGPSVMNYPFNIPELKVGNIDSLVALSDALKKVNVSVEQVLRKMAAAYNELQKDKTDTKKKKEIEPPIHPLTRFTWQEARYPLSRKSLPELTQIIKGDFQTFEKDLRTKSQQYNTIKQRLAQVEQNETGSLLTRDLNKDLGGFQPIESDYLTTLYVVVPKNEQKTWLKTYETLTEYIVPKSSCKITEDNEYGLYSVVLFQRFAEEFKNAARAKRFTVRKNDPTSVISEEERKKLVLERTNTANKFEKWALNSFNDAFMSWIHLKCIQCYVESILRFGLPADFQAMLLVPRKGQEKKLEKALCKLYAYLGTFNDDGEDEKDDKAVAILGQEKFFPYVFLELDVNFAQQQRK